MKINSDVTIYNMVIENIKTLKDENITLNKNLDELKKIINQNNQSKDYYNIMPSPISIKNYNNSQTSEEIIKKNNKYIYNFDSTSIDNEINEENDDDGDDYLYKTYQDYNHLLYNKYK